MDDMTTAPASPPPTRTATDYRRPLEGRILAGVSLGLARNWGAPVWVVRTGFIVLTFFGGLGALLYAAAWLLMPSEGSTAAPIATGLERLRGGQAWLGVGLVFLAVVIALSSIDALNGGLVWAVALIVLGVLLYRGDLGRLSGGPRERDTEPFTTPPGVAAISAGPTPLESPAGGGGEGSALPVPQPEPAPRLPRSYLGRLTFGALAVTIGVMSLFDVAGVTRPTSRHYFAAALVVIGAGLALGTLWGRSRGLIVLGLLLTPLVVGAALIDEPFDGAYDDLLVVAGPSTTIQPTYHLTAGRIVLDLRDLDPNGGTVDVAARVGAGEIEVYVPDGVTVVATGRSRLGEVDLLGVRDTGWDSESGPVVREGSQGTLNLDLDAGIGAVYAYEAGRYGFPSAGGRHGRDQIVEINPDTLADLGGSYDLTEGQLILDLSGLDMEGAGRRVEATVGAGMLTVIVPDDAAVEGTANATAGQIDLFGESPTVGTNLELAIDRPGDNGTLQLVLAIDAGTITVQED